MALGVSGKELDIPEADDRIRRLVWRHLTTKGVRELSDLTGLPVEKVLVLRQEMLDNVDSLTVDQQRTKLLVDLQELAERAREFANTTSDDRAIPPALTASVQAMKTVLNELRNIERQGKSDVDRLNSLRQRELVQLIRKTVDNSVEEISSRYDIPEAELFDIFNARFTEAAMEMEERNT